MHMNNQIKSLLRSIRQLLPESMQTFIYKSRFYLSSPKLTSSLFNYTYTDEHVKFVHILEAINYMRVAGVEGNVLPQTFLEFGCHSGRTFCAAVNAAGFFKMSYAEFYAFDSFEGLPETDPVEDGIFQQGTFYTSRKDFVRIVKKKTGLRLTDKNIVQGYYCNSLTPDLQARMPKAGVVHIDVDLYSSTVDVLRFLSPILVQGTLLLFDDWYCYPGGSLKGERRALTEFLAENSGFKVEPWKAYSTFGQSYFVTMVPNPNNE